MCVKGFALPGLGTSPDHRTHIWRGSQTPQPVPLFMDVYQELLPPKHELLGLLHDIIAIKGWWKLTLLCSVLTSSSVFKTILLTKALSRF